MTFVFTNHDDLAIHTRQTLVGAVRKPEDPPTQLSVHGREVLVCLTSQLG